MNESSQTTPFTQSDIDLARERTKQVSIVGWTGGLTAFFAVGALTAKPEWPVAIGVAAVAAIVAFLCFGILKRQ